MVVRDAGGVDGAWQVGVPHHLGLDLVGHHDRPCGHLPDHWDHHWLDLHDRQVVDVPVQVVHWAHLVVVHVVPDVLGVPGHLLWLGWVAGGDAVFHGGLGLTLDPLLGTPEVVQFLPDVLLPLLVVKLVDETVAVLRPLKLVEPVPLLVNLVSLLVIDLVPLLIDLVDLVLPLVVVLVGKQLLDQHFTLLLRGLVVQLLDVPLLLVELLVTPVVLEVNLIHQSLIQVVVDVDLVEVAYHAVIQLLFQPLGLLLLLDLLVVLERLSLPVPVDLNLILVVGTISVRHLRLVDLGVSCLTNLVWVCFPLVDHLDGCRQRIRVESVAEGQGLAQIGSGREEYIGVPHSSLSDSVAEVNVVDVDVRDHLSDVGLTEVVDVLLSNQELRLS